MKLETSIKPRKDGVVIANLPDKAKYEFKPGTDGMLECDVENDAHVAWLIGTGNFYPAESADFGEAADLVKDEGKGNGKGKGKGKAEAEAEPSDPQ